MMSTSMMSTSKTSTGRPAARARRARPMGTRRTPAVLLAAMTTTALLLAGCGRSPSAPAGPAPATTGATVIAGSFPESGPLAGAGASGRGLAAYLARMNAQGGVNGQPVRWVAYDDGYDPARMAANARRAVEQDKASVFVSFGAPSLAIRTYLNQHKVFHLVLAGNTALSQTSQFPYTHAWFPDIAWEAAVDAAYLKRQGNSVKLGILGINNDIPDSAASGARLAGVPPALVLKLPATQVDVRAQVTQLKEAGVNAVLLVGSPAQVVSGVKYMRAIRYSPTIMVNSISAGRNVTINPLGAAATGIYTSLWINDPADPLWATEAGQSEFTADVTRYGRAADTREQVTEMGYAAGEALTHALTSAGGGATAETINKAWNAISGLRVTGLPPEATLDATGNTGRLVHSFQLVRFDGTGWQPQGTPVDAAAAGYAK